MDRRARLEALREERDSLRKRLTALGLLTERLAEAGIEPILVGGTALAFYTAGGYATEGNEDAGRRPAPGALDLAGQVV
jgi:hypothetical protein